MATRTTAAPPPDAASPDSGSNDTTESASALERTTPSTDSAVITAPSADFLLHVAQQINQGFQSSLTKVVADINNEYGFAPVLLEQKGDGAFDLAALQHELPTTTDGVHQLIHELQASRRRQRELQQRVDELQSEQRVATERVALYAELAQQLKRGLVNERVAHAQTKRDASVQSVWVQQRQQHQQQQTQRDSGDEKPSVLGLPSPGNDDDPWSSPPSKSVGGSAGAATSNILSFSSFYQSPRLLSTDDEPPSPMSSTSGGSGLQPLRGSMMDQFLPASLLDSPQVTPSSRKSLSREDDDDADERNSSRLAFASEITRGLGAFALLEPPCVQCKQQPQSTCAPCGHSLCARCETSVLAKPETTRTCPRCRTAVSGVKDLETGQLRNSDNQREHVGRADAPSAVASERKQSGTMTSADAPADRSASTVSPVTLSLLAELFDAIPLEQLEAALTAANGEAPRAIELLLETHASFYPSGSTSRRSSSSASLTQSQSPLPSGQKSSGVTTRSTSASASSQLAASSSSANWKTEMCMYYLQGKCNKTRRTCSFAHGESDLVRPTSVGAKQAAAGYKTRMCPLFLEGTCPKSRRDCLLAHGESDLRDGLAALASTVALPAAAPRLQSYKTELCYYYLKGCCNYSKDECRFAHGENDLRTVESNTLEWTAKLVGATGEFQPGSATASSSGSGLALPSASAGGDKYQHQHQYQQQYQQQQQQQQPPQPPPSQQLQHTSPAFTPAHQLPLSHALALQPPHHQFAAFQQQQHMPPPPHMPMPMPHSHHLAHQQQHQHQHQQQQQQQQGMYHSSQPPHQFRYSMDANKRTARPPPPPRRDSTSWSSGGYDGTSGADF